jgi:hypothetical protein
MLEARRDVTGVGECEPASLNTTWTAGAKEPMTRLSPPEKFFNRIRMRRRSIRMAGWGGKLFPTIEPAFHDHIPR